MAAVPYIWFRGRKMTPAFRDAWLAAEQRASSILGRPVRFRMSQGGFNKGAVAASADTHNGDAGDWSVYWPDGTYMTCYEIGVVIESLRWAGIFASLRTDGPKCGVRAQGFKGGYHIHGVPCGWGSPSLGARLQVEEIRRGVKRGYRNGRDGLSSNGADVGPGHVSTYRHLSTHRTPDLPGLPSTGDGPATTAPAVPTVPKEMFTMSQMAEINARFDALEAQNRAIHNDTAGRAATNERALDVWRVPVQYSSGPVASIQVLANAAKSALAANAKIDGLTAAVSLLARSAGREIDMTEVSKAVEAGADKALAGHQREMAGMLEAMELSIRAAVVESMGDIDAEYANNVADAVLAGIAERITAGVAA